MIRNLVWVLVLSLLIAFSVAVAAQIPQQGLGQGALWAYFVPDKDQPPEEDPGPRHMPGSTKAYTHAEIEDHFNPPDWYPEEHGPVPSIIQHGIPEKAQACGSCHLMSGTGHPESANLAGLDADYIMRQMDDFKSGIRQNGRPMAQAANEVPEEELRKAAEWFAALKPKIWVRVIETETVPKTYINKSYMRLPISGGGTEPLGNRIVELPEDPARATSRDSHSGFVAYVPVGSLAKGEALVKTGDAGKTTRCEICHGPSLHGSSEVPSPRITGVSPLSTARQLYAFQLGTRGGPLAVLMKSVVAHLNDDDIIAICAYLASQKP